jgi:hypothetical protein
MAGASGDVEDAHAGCDVGRIEQRRDHQCGDGREERIVVRRDAVVRVALEGTQVFRVIGHGRGQATAGAGSTA